MSTRARVDAHDPKLPELPLPHLAVAIRIGKGALDLLLGVRVVRLLESPVALGLAEDLAPLLAGVNGALDAGHFLTPAQHLVDGLLVCGVDGVVLTELALLLRRLVHE